ncbi:MAG: helix-turn-helix domain-containing protein [Comamonadaceae bacterium]|nr:helix-turn-helix domain-containing protein [Comamonadaceae bacterium]
MLGELAPQREVTLSAELALAFARHRWPGNLRQLHNALATACALLDDDETAIGWQHLADDLVEDLRERRDPRDTAAAEDAVDLRAQSRRTVRAVLADCAGNRSEAARRLGISRNTLYRKMRELRLG